ncbi:recombinase family protein [Kineococcus esterisolvens]|uniref:recombinase family protein n=1 Tax=unclassified Kineococcus TaxID=2621656 RepID=UPI003D7F07E9
MIYTRISRDDTGEGRSNERQREDCEKLADLRGWEVAYVEEDISVSAYSGRKRPGWERVLDHIEAGRVDVVLAWHIDRMTRSMLDLEELILLGEDKGVGVATVSGDIDLTTDVGRMVARILAAVARAEVERKGARQRLANRQRAAEGYRWRSAWRGFGYEKDGTLIPREADMIRDAAERVLNGEPLRAIVRDWRASGVSTPRSSRGADGWTHNGVRSILLNPRNAAIATYRGEVIGRGQWEPVFSEETHTLLVAKLTNPSRLTRTKTPSRGRAPLNLLTSIARCSVCSEPVNGGTGYKGRLIYQCPSYHVSTPRDEADAIVRWAFAATIATVGADAIHPAGAGEAPEALWRQQSTLRDRLDSLSTSFAHGNITIEQLESASRTLRAQLVEVEEQIADAVAPTSDPFEVRSEHVQNFANAGLDEQRSALKALATVRLYPRGRGRKNVPIKQQVTMTLTLPGRGGREVVALDERTDTPAWVGQEPAPQDLPRRRSGPNLEAMPTPAEPRRHLRAVSASE